MQFLEPGYLHRESCRWSHKQTLGGDIGECLEKLVDCDIGLSMFMFRHEGNLPLIHIILPAAPWHLRHRCSCWPPHRTSFLPHGTLAFQPAPPAAFCSHSATSLLFFFNWLHSFRRWVCLMLNHKHTKHKCWFPASFDLPATLPNIMIPARVLIPRQPETRVHCISISTK